ncbi:MAG: ligase-associated DNA damage response exonuclease [Hyphomicrobiaceae bacterium]
MSGVRCAVEDWLYPTPHGLYCAAGDFHIDAHRPVERAVITHGHADHARAGHGHVMATPETCQIMRARLGEQSAGAFQEELYGNSVKIKDATVALVPAGHVTGSAQVVIEHGGSRAVISGDYKRTADQTCAAFEVVPCDVFITEATFGLPVFRHEPDHKEIGRLLHSVATVTERTHLVGVYGLGKCQRLILLLRQAGFDGPIWLHGALKTMCDLYGAFGINLGDLRLVAEADSVLAGEIVLCPPSALNDRWSRRLADPLVVMASGWMRVRARARQRGVELPLIISDHADWPELLTTIAETGAPEVWVTHGREDALVHQLQLMGLTGRALALVGREDEVE